MKNLNKIILSLVFLSLTIFIVNLFLLNYGSKKIPAFMLSHNQELHPEITAEERRNAEIFFGRFPFLYRSCFNYFLINKKEASELKGICVTFLPTKSPPWALKYLFNYLRDSDPEIRIGAASAFQLYENNNEIFSKLSTAWTDEKDWHVQEILATTLFKYDGEAIGVFGKRLNDPDNKIRVVAAASLYEVASNDKNLKALKTLYDSSDAEDRRLVMVSAYNLFKNKSKPVLSFGVKDNDSKTRAVALKLIHDGDL